VRSKDQTDIGNVISETGETFTVMQGASREYNIPKFAVEGFDGSELYLSIPFSEVLNYKVAYPLLLTNFYFYESGKQSHFKGNRQVERCEFKNQILKR